MEVKLFKAGSGVYEVEAVVAVADKGLTATVCSARYSHVGATAQATPRASSTNPSERSATVSVLTIAPHKDDRPASRLAHALAAQLNVPCSVSCGMHIPKASQQDIQQLMESVDIIERQIVAFAARVLRATWSMDAKVVAVTPSGDPVGSVSRMKAHTGQGVLHQAFSVYMIDRQGKLMLCRRSRNKKLWKGVLGDSCSGHPYPGEPVAKAALRRIGEELSVSAQLTTLGSFVYREDYSDGHCECEWCEVFAGRACKPMGNTVNEAEIEEVVWLSLNDVLNEQAELAPWVVLALKNEKIRGALENYVEAERR